MTFIIFFNNADYGRFYSFKSSRHASIIDYGFSRKVMGLWVLIFIIFIVNRRHLQSCLVFALFLVNDKNKSFKFMFHKM